MANIPYPTKTRTWDRTTPNDGDLFDNEFDQIYANTNDLDTRIQSIGKQVGEIFALILDKPIATTFPAIRIYQEQVLNDTNHPDIFPVLYNQQIVINGATQFAISGADNDAGFMRLQLQTNANNLAFIAALYDDALYHGDGVTNYANWRTITVPADIGPLLTGTYQITNLDPVTNQITINVGYQAGVASGNIEAFWYRIPGSTTTVRWFAVTDSVIRSPGGDAVPGVRLLDRFQGHWHIVKDTSSGYLLNSIIQGQSGSYASGSNYGGIRAEPLAADDIRAIDAISDTVNGTPRTGPTTRDRSLSAYLYMYIGRYIP